MDLELRGKVVIVSGGGAGIGASISLALAREAAVPVIFGRSPLKSEFAQELGNAGPKSHFVQVELSDDAGCAAAVAEVADRFGRIDGLVNNAGVNDGIGLEAGSAEFRASLERNLVHYYALAHHCLPGLRASRGAIVRKHDPKMPLFFNSGHMRRGLRNRYSDFYTHLELESLPTAGWGYEHFPLSARYVDPLGIPFLGMTGKFHTHWGEVRKGGFTYFSFPIFSCYHRVGAVAMLEIAEKLIADTLGGPKMVATSLPRAGRVTIRHQPDQNRDIVHLLHATPALRGQFRNANVQPIQDLTTLRDVAVTLSASGALRSVRLVPSGEELAFSVENDRISFVVPSVTGHQMVEVRY